MFVFIEMPIDVALNHPEYLDEHIHFVVNGRPSRHLEVPKGVTVITSN